MQALNHFLNKLLLLDVQHREYLTKLSGKSLQIHLKTRFFEKIFSIVFTRDSVQCVDYLSPPASILVMGPLAAFLKLALTKNIHAAVHLGLSVSGDHHAIEELQGLLVSLDIDWEECLAQFMGDVIAHPIANKMRQMNVQRKKIAHSATQSVSEYLTEEIRACPTRYEINIFMNAVDSLRADMERLELRMARWVNHTQDVQ